MKWVTWENIGVDRMACCWLIKKYIDQEAEFTFIPEGEQEIPDGTRGFDIPGAEFSHRNGRCSFYSLIEDYNLEDSALNRIAQIVDEADTVQEVFLEPVAPGLDFICDGISQDSKDDYEALEKGIIIYEALYAMIKRNNHL
ncbi:chromate resistance protein [Alkalihalobacillus sp. MEB130]|uniref:chromate resistance protein ChrB domain-containing protein n=1 Tax=Alkalihalobacillus sp. MEB130 TaxID=2976704 RepID=UPI0028DFAB80|nr:chromate resistance protein ChrB domain-containing protein [Alkalihalobacillus sp. MEB130]MDT8861485.1 chromate resistance protein [Alkalihalobacillus sp. MEB130]